MKMLIVILMLFSFVAFAEPVDINRADATAIAKALKNVGPKKAEAIVQYRKDHGDFKTLKDLENVKGIGEKTALANEKEIIFSDSTASSDKPADKSDEKTVSKVEKLDSSKTIK